MQLVLTYSHPTRAHQQTLSILLMQCFQESPNVCKCGLLTRSPDA